MHLLDKSAHFNKLARRSPIEKALLSLGMLTLCLSLPHWPGCAIVFLVMSSFTLFAARIKPLDYLKALAAPAAFLLAGSAMLLISVEVSSGGLHIAMAPKGVEEAERVMLRSLSALSCLLFLAMSTPLPELLAKLRSLGVPSALIEAALLIYNWLFLLLENFNDMKLAQETRLGYASPSKAFRSLSMLASALLVRSFERARRLEDGLAARGFQGELKVADTSRPCSPLAIAGIMSVLAATTIFTLALA